MAVDVHKGDEETFGLAEVLKRMSDSLQANPGVPHKPAIVVVISVTEKDECIVTTASGTQETPPLLVARVLTEALRNTLVGMDMPEGVQH